MEVTATAVDRRAPVTQSVGHLGEITLEKPPTIRVFARNPTIPISRRRTAA